MKMGRNIRTMVVFLIFLMFFYLQQMGKEKRIMKAFDWLTRSANNEVHYIDQIKHLCGELCHLEKDITPGEFLGSVKAQVILIFQSIGFPIFCCR
jgi:hypothetical protein